MVLSSITHLVVYRPYRVPSTEPKSVALFNDVREAMSFAGSHSRYCSSMDTIKCDCVLTEELLQAIARG